MMRILWIRIRNTDGCRYEMTISFTHFTVPQEFVDSREAIGHQAAVGVHRVQGGGEGNACSWRYIIKAVLWIRTSLCQLSLQLLVKRQGFRHRYFSVSNLENILKYYKTLHFISQCCGSKYIVLGSGSRMCPSFEKNVKNDFVNILVFDKNIFLLNTDPIC